MELLCAALKANGSLLARTLSYEGATFELRKVTTDDRGREQYDRLARVTSFLTEAFRALCHPDDKRAWEGIFWGAHQRVFRSMVLCAKVRAVVGITEQALKDGKCVVLGLQSTGCVPPATRRLRPSAFSHPRGRRQHFVHPNSLETKQLTSEPERTGAPAAAALSRRSFPATLRQIPSMRRCV